MEPAEGEGGQGGVCSLEVQRPEQLLTLTVTVSHTRAPTPPGTVFSSVGCSSAGHLGPLLLSGPPESSGGQGDIRIVSNALRMGMTGRKQFSVVLFL